MAGEQEVTVQALQEKIKQLTQHNENLVQYNEVLTTNLLQQENQTLKNAFVICYDAAVVLVQTLEQLIKKDTPNGV